MITKEKIRRINELSNKKKVMPLSEVELEEQQALRAEYLKAIRKNCREQLDLIEIVDEPQCQNKKNKGDNEMKNNGTYDKAEELAMETQNEAGGEKSSYRKAEGLAQETKGESGGEDSTYYEAEELANETKGGGVNSEDEIKKKNATKKADANKRANPLNLDSSKGNNNRLIYTEAECLAQENLKVTGVDEGTYGNAEEFAKENLKEAGPDGGTYDNAEELAKKTKK